MSTKGCKRVELVEALRDGRLGANDRASMERHVATCPACRAHAEDLERIGDVLRAPLDPATPLEHQRARLALLRRAAEGTPAAAPQRAWSTRFVLAAAVLSVAVALGWAGARLTAPEAAPVALHMRPPPRLAVARETTLKPSDDARFERSRAAQVEVVSISSGTIDFTVRPLAPGERFVVRTDDAEVDVRATAFRIEADHGKIRAVAVAEGTVEVRYAGFTAVIPAGGSWRAAAETPAPVAATPAPEPKVAAVDGSPPSLPARAVAHAEPPAPRPKALPRQVAPPPEPSRVAVEEPRVAPPEPPAPTASQASRAFGEAMAAMRRGDYAGSAAQLERFASAHGSDARADEADYLRAIALQRAGKAAEAADAARRYLDTRPHGAHRAEAKRIAAR